jgi:hypothetical protein
LCACCGDKSFITKVDGQWCLGQLQNAKTHPIDVKMDMSTLENGDLMQKVTVLTVVA